MKLKLHELKEPLQITVTQDDAWFKNIFTRSKLKFKEPLSLHLEINKEKEDVFFQGHLIATLILTCSRCAEEAILHIDEFFAPVFTHGIDPAIGDRELKSDELEITYFQGDEIDIDEMMQEQLLLLIPLQPLCLEDCKGICATCAQNLNVKACQCEKEVTYSPFGVLKRLEIPKSKKKRGK